MIPVSKISVEARVEQFLDFYAKENQLFCKFCLHSFDPIKNYIKSKTHETKEVFKNDF